MSVQACNWAIQQRVGSGYLKATLLAVATCYRGAAVTIDEIVAETGRSEKTVRRHLRLLSSVGFISVASGLASLNMGEQK
jgi:predicted ArsR family transcriptional regulator